MAGTARARARAQLTQEIKEEARRQLAADGAAALSVRAVARALGMASSAVYRYYPSRDDLLTALIIDAYDAVGQAAEDAERAYKGAAPARTWLEVCRAIRAWAVANPHEYALVYGSPVPGYRAPEVTIESASRVTLVLIGIMAGAHPPHAHPPEAHQPPDPPLPRTLQAEAERIATLVLPGADPNVIVRGLIGWTQLFGMISFELFGHLVGSIEDNATFFDVAAQRMGAFIGLEPPGTAGSTRSSTNRGRAQPTPSPTPHQSRQARA